MAAERVTQTSGLDVPDPDRATVGPARGKAPAAVNHERAAVRGERDAGDPVRVPERQELPSGFRVPDARRSILAPGRDQPPIAAEGGLRDPVPMTGEDGPLGSGLGVPDSF